MALFLVAANCIEVLKEVAWIVFWSLLSVTLAIVLGLAFWRLVKLQKEVDGIFCDERLMCIHWAAFFFATFFVVLLLIFDVLIKIEE